MLFPVVLALATIYDWPGHGLTAIELAITIATTAFALVAGYLRGRSALMERASDGRIVTARGWVTLVLYLVTLGTHAGLDAVFHVTDNKALLATVPPYLLALTVGRLAVMMPRARALPHA